MLWWLPSGFRRISTAAAEDCITRGEHSSPTDLTAFALPNSTLWWNGRANRPWKNTIRELALPAEERAARRCGDSGGEEAHGEAATARRLSASPDERRDPGRGRSESQNTKKEKRTETNTTWPSLHGPMRIGARAQEEISRGRIKKREREREISRGRRNSSSRRH